MNYLLDTHVFLWVLADPARLSSEAAALIRSPERSVFVSAVSAVEIAVKAALGKLDAPERLENEIGSRGFWELPLRFRHAELMRSLPQRHRDPFDRMLVAQARGEDLVLVTADRKFEMYDVRVVWT